MKLDKLLEDWPNYSNRDLAKKYKITIGQLLYIRRNLTKKPPKKNKWFKRK